MRINRFVASSTGESRRKADGIILAGRVMLNGKPAKAGDTVGESDVVLLDKKELFLPKTSVILLLNKPVGYVCSRNGQGSKTVYDLLPRTFHDLKPIGRLDKDSSGLLLLTNDGRLANQLTHPKFQKEKRYTVTLNKVLDKNDFEMIVKTGVKLDDGLSKFRLGSVNNKNFEWEVTMTEGRNRQIRRTFKKLGYDVKNLHREKFGNYDISQIEKGSNYCIININE